MDFFAVEAGQKPLISSVINKGTNMTKDKILLEQQIENKIYLVRRKKVMFDKDLAELYEIPTRLLNQAVKRNIKRFPEDFMIQLNKQEFENWRSQIVTSNPAAKMSLRRSPYVFTELGVAMLSSVLNSEIAIKINIGIMRVFVRIRQIVDTHRDIAQKINQLERKYEQHDYQIQKIFDTIRELPKLQETHIKINGFKKNKSI